MHFTRIGRFCDSNTRFRFGVWPHIAIGALAWATAVTGTLTIEVEVTQATKSVSLHAHQLSISDVEFVGGDGKKVAAETIAFNVKSQTVTFGFGEDLPVTR